MRRVTGIFGGDPKPPAGGNPDSNTLISEMTTVICLDDYHSLDREGRKVAKVCLIDVWMLGCMDAWMLGGRGGGWRERGAASVPVTTNFRDHLALVSHGLW